MNEKQKKEIVKEDQEKESRFFMKTITDSEEPDWCTYVRDTKD